MTVERSIPGLRRALLLTLLFAALHMAMAALIPVFEDEAYYALWATHLAPDYYDHPPMIALWIRAGEAIFGAVPAGIRLLCVLGFAAVTPLVWDIARRLGLTAHQALWAIVFYNATALPAALGFSATPDAPSSFFWALTLWLVVVAVQSERKTVWLLAGCAAACGVLSKFTNLFLGTGLVLWLLATPAGRAELRRPGPWIMLAATLALLCPSVLWNAEHDWYGLHRQFGRIDGAPDEGMHLLDYLGALVLGVSPLIVPLVVLGTPRFWHGTGSLLSATTLPLLLYLGFHAVHARVQANWTVPVFPALAILAASAVTERARRYAVAAAGTAFLLCALGLTLSFWPGKPVFPGNNPANQTKGWPAISTELKAQAAASGAVWIATVDYGTTAELALHLAPLPVWSVAEPARYLFRGPLPADLCTRPGLIVTTGRISADLAPEHLFRTVGTTRDLWRRSGAAPIALYRVTPVRGLLTCPEPAS